MGTERTTTELRTAVLTPASVKEGVPANLAEAIRTFEPLPFEAGSDATNWLQRKIDEQTLPITTVLALAPDEDRLCGFIAMGFTAIVLSAGDRPMAEVGLAQRGYRLEDLGPPHLAADISWIARGTSTRKGFGQRLFDCAVNFAIDNRAIAMVVTPHDEETARKVWIDRFHFRYPRSAGQPDKTSSRLWYPVHKPDPLYPS